MDATHDENWVGSGGESPRIAIGTVRPYVLVLALIAMNAQAQLGALERLIMPGPLVEAHAEFEDDCQSCHVQFERGLQRQLCVACHEEIAADLSSARGFHGLNPEIRDTAECAQCHTDHEGKSFDIVRLNVATFDHAQTDFPLTGRHREAECTDCHISDTRYRDAGSECVSCHREDDRHFGNLGDACADCHSSATWTEIRFDHEAVTGHTLEGAHRDIACASCHIDEQYEGTSRECVACHRQDDTHMGNNGRECQSCHIQQDWARPLFDHLERTGFGLVGGHSGIDCESCHTGNKLEEMLPTECYGCHAKDDEHHGINGQICSDCHRVTEWPDVSFDHARDAGFELHDAHAELACGSCHLEPVSVALPAAECYGCHSDDDPHGGQLGTDCGSCHLETLFAADVRFDHDLIAFPLLGHHDDADCESCHETHAFLDAPERCVDCHDDDAHEGRLSSDCALCHTPNDWQLWVFDHDAQTEFPLEGAHAGLDCLACHREPTETVAAPVAATCGSCHRGDDQHDGEFGQDCERCHTTESFGAVRVVQ